MARTTTRSTAAADPAYEPPPCYALPGEPPIPVRESKRRRKSPVIRAIQRLPRSEQAEASRETATVQFYIANESRVRGEHQAADVAFEWAVFHATRAVILTAMLGGRHE